jgi:xylulose-5-phosphate/fructose-6-phosphate phosphoketolase
MDAINRLPQTGVAGFELKGTLDVKLHEHRLYINQYGEDMPEIRNWKWDASKWSTRSS